MATANDLLVSEDFGKASLRTLVMRTLAPFGVEDQARFSIVGDEIELPSNLVPAYALVMHELATATKYGALSNESGLVEIGWKIDTRAKGRALVLSWTERDGPPVVAPARTSFGTQLIQRLLANEAGGVASVSYEPSGLSFVARVPLA